MKCYQQVFGWMCFYISASYASAPKDESLEISLSIPSGYHSIPPQSLTLSLFPEALELSEHSTLTEGNDLKHLQELTNTIQSLIISREARRKSCNQSLDDKKPFPAPFFLEHYFSTLERQREFFKQWKSFKNALSDPQSFTNRTILTIEDKSKDEK
jgi:hypothetical protein